MVKCQMSDEMSSVNNAVNVLKYPGYITDTMVDYVRPVTRKKPDDISIQVGMNDLIKGLTQCPKLGK